MRKYGVFKVKDHVTSSTAAPLTADALSGAAIDETKNRS
jgi:hypothetical protein